MKRSRGRSDRAPPNAYDRALGMLARREYSQRELRARLERAGCDEGDSAAALAKLRGQHYQDDRRFGEMLVRTRAGQGYGPARIRAELRAHGLADALIRELLDAAAVDWAELAITQLRKHYGVKPVAAAAERAKRAAFLLRRGFAAATVRTVTRADFADPDA